jgi:predicted PurR-regulated permease PerM
MLPRALTTLGVVPEESPDSSTSQPVRWPPRWIVAVVFVFWLGWLGSGVAVDVWHRISGLVLLLVISLFLALAIEPGVNRLGRHGWGRGRATATIMFGVIIAIGVFIGAMGTLIGTQIADLLSNSETYISDTVDTINDWFGTEIDAEQVIADFNDPNGSVQQFIDSQQDDAIRLSGQVLNGLLAAFSVLLFSYYPRGRRSTVASIDLLTPATRSPSPGALCLGTRDQQDRRLPLLAAVALADVSGVPLGGVRGRWGAFTGGLGALGRISQPVPPGHRHLHRGNPAGAHHLLDSPVRALIVLGVIAVYQQLENYLISPKVTARTMELHPAIAFGAALAGLALLGPAGAVLALPTAAMAQALISEWGARHDVIDSPLTAVSEPRSVVRRVRRRGGGEA